MAIHLLPLWAFMACSRVNFLLIGHLQHELLDVKMQK
jgi:hypothetical protein